MGHLALADPAVGEAVLQGREHTLGGLLPTAPVGAVVVRALDVDTLAVAVEQRAAARPARGVGVVVLVIKAQGQEGVIAEVGFEGAEIDPGLALVAVHERVLVLVGRHGTAANVAAVGKRAADVDLGAVVIPTAGTDIDAGLEFAGRFFADQVDRRPRGSGTGQEAGGTLEDFHAVVDGHVTQGLPRGVRRVAQGGNAVVLEILDRETAGIVVGALAVEGRDGDARGMAHHLIDGVEAEIIHMLTGNHGDRLRRFPWRQYHACGRGDGAGGIRAAAFGDGTELVGGDLGGLQLQFTVALRRSGNNPVTVAVSDRLQAQRGEQPLQSFVDCKVAAQATAADACSQARVHRDHHAGLLAKAAQHRVQAARRNAVDMLAA